VPARRGPHDGMAIILGEAPLALLVHYVNRIVTLPANERATLHKRGEILNFRRIAIIRRHSVATSPTAMNEFLVRTKVDSLRNQLYRVFHKWKTPSNKNCKKYTFVPNYVWDSFEIIYLFYFFIAKNLLRICQRNTILRLVTSRYLWNILYYD